MIPIARITSVTSLISFVIGLPTVVATYYQALRGRQEAREARSASIIHSENCLEFIYERDGSCINLVPLETLHSLPKPGDIVLLPGDGVVSDTAFRTGAFQIKRIEHIYARVGRDSLRPGEARLTKTVAHVISIHDEIPEDNPSEAHRLTPS